MQEKKEPDKNPKHGFSSWMKTATVPVLAVLEIRLMSGLVVGGSSGDGGGFYPRLPVLLLPTPPSGFSLLPLSGNIYILSWG